MERRKVKLRLFPAGIFVVISICGWIPSGVIQTQAADIEVSNSSSLKGGGDSIQRPAGIAVSHNSYNIATIDNNKTNVLTGSDRDFKPVSSSDGKYLVFFRVLKFGDGTFGT